MSSTSRRLRSRLYAVVPIVLGLCFSTGCDAINKLKQAASAERENSAAGSTSGPGGTNGQQNLNFDPDDPDAPLADKLNHPIDCINKASPAVLRSKDRYLSWVDEKKGPTGTEKYAYGLYEVHESLVTICKNALQALAKKQNPATPELDKIIVDYEKKLDAIIPLAKDANNYYTQKDYQDDKFAKAKQIHAPLMTAFNEFAAADKALRAEVARLKSGMDERELARIEKKQGKNLLWHVKKLNIVAKALVEMTDSDLASLDLTKVEPAVKELETITNDTDKYATEHKDETSKILTFSIYISNAKEYLTAAKSMMRRKRDKKDYDRGEKMMMQNSPQMVDGHPAQVVDKYNRLVDQSNSMLR